LGFDLCELIEPAGAAAGANAASFRPRFWRADIRVPEGPGAALPRASVVDAALSGRTIEENAITIGEFDETFSHANLADKARLKIFDFESHFRCELGYIFFVDPDETGRARAAVAATGALEVEAVFVPGLFFPLCHVYSNQTNHEGTKTRSDFTVELIAQNVVSRPS